MVRSNTANTGSLSAKMSTNIGDDFLSRTTIGEWGNPVTYGDEMAASITPGEAQLLYGMVRAMRPITVLEWGTGHGYSTLHIAQALKDNRIGHLFTIEQNPLRQGDAMGNIKSKGLSDCVDFLKEPPNALPDIDFAFLDAGHDMKSVQTYLEYIEKHGCKYALVHDADWDNHVRDAIAGTNWRMILLPDTSKAGIAVLKRIK